MVDSLLQPLGLFVIALGAAFLIPLFFRASRILATLVFLATLAGMTVIAAWNLLALLKGAPAMEILTAGVAPPFSINLRFGLSEGGFVLAVNLIALLAAWHYLPTLRTQASALLLYLVMVMGINGMVMTRDLFNLFIFIEITSIATYALIGMQHTAGGLAAGFKYIIATSIASAFFLLGTIFLYYLTGTLNIDDMVAHRELIYGPVGFIATLFLLTSLLIELKPYPANGWGLDVYETAPGGIASLISVGVSAGAFFALFKTLSLLNDYLTSIAVIGGATFLVSNLIGLKQGNAKRLLGYSSIGQMGLLTLALAATVQLDAEEQMPLIIGGLFINHLLAKAGLFWLAELLERPAVKNWSALAGRPLLLLVFGTLLAALVGLPPFPGFWAKWVLVLELAAGGLYPWIAVILLGSLLEAAYLFRWFTRALEAHENDKPATIGIGQLAPVALAAVLLYATGYGMAAQLGNGTLAVFLPLLAGGALWLLDGLPGRLKSLLMLTMVAAGGAWLTLELEGLNRIFGFVLVGGGVLISLATQYRADQRRGFYPLLTILLLSLATLLRAQTSLTFFFSWELMTVSSYLLITLGRNGVKPSLTYLLFSLGSAYCLLAGFAVAYAATGSIALAALGGTGDAMGVVFSLLAAGFVIKTGGRLRRVG
jgi:formate hydrogenlyase subunit 3/multisubunit Na+/H+ antiporter MnhD subunit